VPSMGSLAVVGKRSGGSASRRQTTSASAAEVRASPVTRAESRDENAEWYPYLLIKPDPRCPECVTIMDWRSAHRGIIITDGRR